LKELFAEMNKQYSSPEIALNDLLFDGMTIMSGGFGLCGIPENLIKAIQDSGVMNLTIISTACGLEDAGVGQLLEKKKIRKLIVSYVGNNKSFEKSVLNGLIDVEFVPQGTLAERIRAGGAGIPAFFTKTGFGTEAASRKEIRFFADDWYLLEPSLHADLSIVKAWKGDQFGNLVYRKTSQNFNTIMATAASVCVAEVEKLVDSAELDSNFIHTSSVYVDRVIQGQAYEKRIERLTNIQKPENRNLNG
jgi:3-oxoacid CoA-transferase subunit A